MSELMLTSLPCEVCGAPVFQRTARVKRYCSKACYNRWWNETHESATRSGSTERAASATITVRTFDGRHLSFVGYGETNQEAHEHALQQASWLGNFTEVGYVTVDKIQRDLRRTARA